MPEDPEVPTEQLHEALEENAHHAVESWISRVALSAAMLAVLAALTSMLAGHHANEAIIEQLKASDQWSFYQSKGIKAGVLGTKIDLFNALGKPSVPQDGAKLEEYKHDQEKIKETAEEMAKAGEDHLRRHNTMARGVTCFQIGIALSAIAVLTKRKPLWYLSILLGGVGVVFLAQGWV